MHYRSDARTATLELRNSKRAGKMDAEMDPVFPLCFQRVARTANKKGMGPRAALLVIC